MKLQVAGQHQLPNQQRADFERRRYGGGMHALHSCVAFLIGASLLAAPTGVLAASCNEQLGIIDSLDMIRLPNGRPGTTVKIAGVPKTMLLDTGGYISGITRETVQELKLQQIGNNRGLTAVNGASTDTLARLPFLEIGHRLQQQNALYYVLPNSSAEFGGVLSGEFFKQYDADFDFGSAKLNFFSPDHCDGKILYWKPPVVAVVPFTLDQSNHISFTMELDGRKVSGILDTGAANTSLNLNVAKNTFGVDVNSPDVQKVGEITGGYTAAVYRKQFMSLMVGDVTIENPAIDLVPDFFVGALSQAPKIGSLISDRQSRLPDLILGMSDMGKLHVYIAYKERKIYISPLNTTPQAP